MTYTRIQNGKKILVANSITNSENNNSYYFIKSPGVRTDNIPSYKLINTPNGLKIPLDKLNSKLQEEIREDIKENALLDFIKNFSLTEALETALSLWMDDVFISVIVKTKDSITVVKLW